MPGNDSTLECSYKGRFYEINSQIDIFECVFLNFLLCH